MSKNRSTWSVLLALVLAMVLMAGLAVTAFAETDGDLTRENLVAVLNGEAAPSDDVNYDVDGNGIVEMADLDAFDGTQEDLLPNGGKDAFSECNPESLSAKTSSAIVRGDSTMSIALDSSVDGYAWIEWIRYDENDEPIPSSILDISGWKELTFDTLWTNGAGALYITIYNDLWETYSITVEATEAGWTTNVIDLLDIPEEFKTIVAMEFTWDGEHEVYIDNLQTAIKLQYVNAGFSSSYDNAGAAKAVIPGTPYGELPELVHTFYTFEGWYLDQSYTQKVTADTIVEADADHTLYAKWSVVSSADVTLNVSNAANNSIGLSLADTGYKQIRFRFNVKAGSMNPGTFTMDYTDGDSSAYNDPIVTIVDENENTVHPSKVEAGKWYTAVIFGGTVFTADGKITSGNLSTGGTLTFVQGAKVQVEHLEAHVGQLGLQLTTRNKASWAMADLSNYGYSYGYQYKQNASNKWDTRIALNIPSGRYTKLSYDFMITDLQSGKENPWYETGLPLTIRERDTGAEVGGSGTALTPGTWYTAEITLNKTGSDYLYFYGQKYNGAEEAARPTFTMYIANMYYVGDGEMIDNVGDANALALNKTGADGTFSTTAVSRDRDYGNLYVVEDSANWADRVLKVTLKDNSKELIQVDFRYLVSKNSRGKDVAPTMKVSTTLSGTMTEAQYIILDENDVPVTTLEIGKWYRLFITANGATAFGLVPATTGEVKLQVKDLAAFNSDELATSMASSNIAAGNISAILSRFGKMEYAYAGTAANAVNIRLNSDLYKQVRFSFRMLNKHTTFGVEGAKLTITDKNGATVNVLNVKVGDWYTATITNDGEALPKNLTMNIDTRTSLIIKDVEGYQSLEIPEEETPSTIFSGLAADEMMIAGFVGPYDEDYFAHWAYDQKLNPLPSMARDDIFKMIADAGINYITDNALNYSGSGKDSAARLLRMASKYGINYMIKTSSIFSIGVPGNKPTDPDEAAKQYAWYLPDYIAPYSNVEALLNELVQYESFGGPFLRDEPGSDLFENIRKARDLVKQYNSNNGTALNTFTNLLPGVGTHRWTNGQTPPPGYTISTWTDYIKCFEGVTDYDYLMFDMYPFAGNEGVIESVFVEYASILGRIAKDNGKMWMGCIQVGGGDLAYYGKRVANEVETHWDVNVMLALGAKGFNYYTLVSAPYFGGSVDPTDDAYTNHSLITVDGSKTRYYDWAKDINTQIKAVDHVLMNATQIGVIFVGDELTYTGGTGNSNTPYKYADKYGNNQNGMVPLITKEGTFQYSQSSFPYTTKTANCGKYADVKLSNVAGDHVMIGAFDYDDKIALYVVNNDIVADEGDTGIDNIQLTFNSSYSYEIIQDGLTTWQTGAVANLTLELGHGALIVVHEGAVSMDATVIYDLNYETSVPAPAPVVLPLGGTYPELPVLKRDFYTFEGWYLNPEGTGNPVKAGDTLAINGSHVLYAKWTYHEDDSLLQPNYSTETGFTSVSRQYIDGVETIVYTTSGKGTPNEGDYQRRFQFNIGDTTKEIVKFRFKYVTSSDASGETVKPMMSYYAGGLLDVDTRGFVIVDENGQPAIGSMEVGQWYTFYGLTSAKSYVCVYPATYGAGYLDITIHIQDRELLDYESDVNISNESNAWYGSTAPYQDNEGNWLIHHRSFTGEHHANTAWNRRIRLENPNGYQTVSFEFRYNVSQYAEAGAELADKIAFAGISPSYFDMNGNVVNVADMKVGQWYKAIIGGTPAASTDFYPMSYSDGDKGRTVNIDMDFRNLMGYETDPSPIVIGSTIGNGGIYRDGDVYKYATSGSAGKWTRGFFVGAPAAKGYVAVEFRFTEAKTAAGVDFAPSLGVLRGGEGNGGQYINSIIILDANGNEVVRNNAETGLTVGEWYTVIVGTKNTSTLELYAAHNYTADAPTIKMEIRERAFVEEFRNGYVVTTPDSFADPMVAWTPADGWHQNIKNNNNAISAWARRTYVTIPTDGAIQLNYEVKINSIYGDAPAQIGIMSGAMYIYEMDGTLVGYNNGHDLEIGKWYKVTISKGDVADKNLGTNYEFVYPGTAGAQAGNVSVSFRNFEAVYPVMIDVDFNLNYANATDSFDPITVQEGSAYGTLPTPTRSGYTFVGWFLDAAGTGNAVTSTTTAATGNHTLYAKWAIGADNSLLQPSYTTETGTTSVTRDYIDEVETIIFTTEGKTLINTGWQRRLEFVNSDTSKEIVKFRFKYVANNNAEGTEVAPKMNYFVGGLNDTNTGHFVVTDANGNVVHDYDVGQWYTFWGLTQGNSRIVLYPCNTTEQLRTTLYIQDRELLDYEEPIYVNQAAHAYQGTTAPYQDAEGNWMIHFRSFTGAEHHANSAEGRQTDLIVNGEYSAVSFQFKFNVSQYAASGAELADKIDIASLNAVYFNADGVKVNIADMKVGQWYTAYVTNGGNNVTTDRFYIQGYTNGTNGNTVNIDMDMRNFQGFEPDTSPVTISGLLRDGDVYKYATSGAAGKWTRRVDVTAPAAKGYVAVEFRFTEAKTAAGVDFAPSLGVLRLNEGNGGQYINSIIILDANGNEVVRNNTETGLTVGEWYTVIVSTKNTSIVELYAAPNHTADAPTIKMEFRERAFVEEFRNGYVVTTPDSFADPMVAWTSADGWHQNIKNNNNAISAWARRTYVTIPTDGAVQLNYEVKINSIYGDAPAQIGIMSGAMYIYEMDGTLVGYNNGHDLEIGKWYKVTISKGDVANKNLGTNYEFVYPGTAGAQAGNVSVSFRNFEAIYPGNAEVSFNLNYAGATGAPATLEVAEGSAYGELPTVSRVGYTFGGWYTEAACTNAVTADTTVSASHTLYAKWTIVEDTNLLQPSYTTETYFTSVSRDFVDGKDTVIYTTNGKPAPTEGDYQKRMQFNLEDTSKELVKFRFQFVTFKDAEGNDAVPQLDFYTGGTTSAYRGNFVIVDEDHNAVSATALEIGKWYTFYGVTRGFDHVSLWPTHNYGKANMNVTLYVQDRELVDFEPEINIRQENTAWYGNTAPYEDKDGNWMFHYRSFTGEQNANTGWNRRTYIDIPEAYTHASFEFKFNVSQYAASGEELADRIEAFYGMSGALYTDMNGDAVAVADLVVGQWYRVTFTKTAYFIAMSDVNGGSGATVNIDMDIRNVVGCNYSSDYTWGTDAGQNAAGIYRGVDNGEAVWVYSTKLYAINSSEWSRRMQLSVANTEGQNISMKVKLVSVTDANGNASTQRKLKLNDANNNEYPAAFIDENGTPVAATELELGKWYTMSWTATGATTYNIWPFTGSIHATIYMKDVVVSDAIENPFGVPSLSEVNNTNVPVGSFGYYGSVTPVMVGDEVMYMHYIKSTNDGTSANNRRAVLSVTAAERTLIRMDVYFTNCSATPSLEIRRNDYPDSAVYYIAIDAEGNICDAANLETGKWYTLMWLAQGNAQYQIRPITGSAANGTYFMKNLTVTTDAAPFSNNYYAWPARYTVGNETRYWVHVRAPYDAQIGDRYVVMNPGAKSGEVISFKMMATNITNNGTPDLLIKNAGGTAMAYTVIAENGNAVSATEMQLGQWYTVSWVADGSDSYKIHAFAGVKVEGDYYMKDVKVSQAENPFKVPTAGELSGNSPSGNSGYYGIVTPVMMNDGIGYKAEYYTRNSGDSTNSWHRRAYLYVASNSGDQISIKVNTFSTTSTPAFKICTSSGTELVSVITDAEGNVVDTMETGKWYTVTWTATGADGYQIQPFNGSGAYGTYGVKDITVTPAA